MIAFVHIHRVVLGISTMYLLILYEENSKSPIKSKGRQFNRKTLLLINVCQIGLHVNVLCLSHSGDVLPLHMTNLSLPSVKN